MESSFKLDTVVVLLESSSGTEESESLVSAIETSVKLASTTESAGP